MIKIAICDDNVQHLHYTAELIRRELSSHQTELSLFPNAEKLLQAVATEKQHPDIAVLDIVLGGENGIQLAKQLNHLTPGCKIIFLTGYPDYASASYEADHIWFVLKSAAETYLAPALKKALAVSEENLLGITAKTGGKTFFIPLGDILYLDRVGRKARIVCKDGIYPVSGKPASLINERIGEYFVQCHQGYWINLRQVKALEKNEFIIEGDIRIPISRSFREEARSCFFARLSELG